MGIGTDGGGSAALGVALFAGALGFAASLDNVQHSPAAHGWNWDLAAINSFGTIPDDALQSVLDAPGVDESAAFTTGPVTIAGTQVSALGIDPKAGAVYLTMSGGRAPLSANEIVLGASTLRTVNASLGDRIEVTTPSGDRTMTVVGVATFPAIGSARFGSMSLGDGAATIASVLPATDPTGRYSGVFLRLVSSGSRAEQIDQLRELVASLGCTDPSCFLVDAKPPQLAGYDDVRSMRLPLGVALASLVTLPLIYGIISTVRSRRRELAVLRALGMTGHQVSGVVILHAVVVACAAVLLGVVAGTLIANITWNLFAHSVGFESSVKVPAFAVALVAVGSVLTATAIAIAVALSPLSAPTRPSELTRLRQCKWVRTARPFDLMGMDATEQAEMVRSGTVRSRDLVAGNVGSHRAARWGDQRVPGGDGRVGACGGGDDRSTARVGSGVAAVGRGDGGDQGRHRRGGPDDGVGFEGGSRHLARGTPRWSHGFGALAR